MIKDRERMGMGRRVSESGSEMSGKMSVMTTMSGVDYDYGFGLDDGRGGYGRSGGGRGGRGGRGGYGAGYGGGGGGGMGMEMGGMHGMHGVPGTPGMIGFDEDLESRESDSVK